MALPGLPARAALINFNFSVDFYPLLQNDGTTELADGSIIQIIMSTDNTAGGFVTYGNSWILDSTVGNDTLIATVPSGLGYTEFETDSGLFTYSVDLDDSYLANYFYIRFFQYDLADIGNLQGNPTNLYWGQSAVLLASNYFELAVFMDFGLTNSYVADEYDSFILIPEPSTMSFFALVGGMTMAMRSQIIRRKRRQQREAAQAESSTS